jgi:uncharacterized DUF497 family protein
MDIGFVWDEKKYNQVVAEHNVLFYEVVSAFDDPYGFEELSTVEHEIRWMYIGKTHWDRLLAVIFTEQDLPLYRIITAYDAEGRWIDEYNQRRGV